ncbi:MAG: NAD(P)/FAD-dependent oxidoreductase [Proteobacteria bacterium]|nr:NAD(P)/FAD-dependent oxidoreductase [Pseudomonadota bacterium]MBU1688350.1 NAD(P)/FAD-dependent oxidoreductase [Pseudomonadota bacterium]
MTDERTFDVIIIGAGPAGLQAALHAVRKKARVVVVGRPGRSSIATAHVENYLCVEGVVAGEELLRIGVAQVKKFGAELLEEDVLHVSQAEDGMVQVRTECCTLSAWALVIATGTSRKKLRVKGEKELAGRGVSYCVDCDANFFRNAKVSVVGDGSAAVDGALTLTGYASEVTLVTHGLDVAKDLADKLKASSVRVMVGTWVREISGEQAVTGVVLENDQVLEVEGVFVELGSKGAMELAVGLGVLLDTETFTHIVTNKKQETNVPGIFSAGDITGHPYQMAKAVGEGCVAGLAAANYARNQQKTVNEVD